MAEPGLDGGTARTVFRSAGRCVLVVLALLVGAAGVALLTARPGYGNTRRGTIALQVLSRMALSALGIRVISRGIPRSGPSLVVANHVSWVDVLVLAAAAPLVPVVRTDVQRWAMIGPMATRVGARYLCRAPSRELAGTVRQITATLRGGHRVLVFPDAGARAGDAPNPFHRAEFQAAVDAAAVISPVALSYRPSPVPALDGGDLLGSLWHILRQGPLVVRVHWLPVIPAVAGPGHRARPRAAAAERSEWAIARALGRPVQRRPEPARLPALALLSSASQQPAAIGMAQVGQPVAGTDPSGSAAIGAAPHAPGAASSGGTDMARVA